MSLKPPLKVTLKSNKVLVITHKQLVLNLKGNFVTISHTVIAQKGTT